MELYRGIESDLCYKDEAAIPKRIDQIDKVDLESPPEFMTKQSGGI